MVKPTAPNEHEYDVVVVGAGLIGALFALLFARRFPSKRIALIEKYSPLDVASQKNLRVLALGHLAKQLLDEVGVFQKLDFTTCFAYQAMRVWDHNSAGELAFNVSDLGGENINELGHMVDSVECTRLLQQECKALNNIDVLYNSSIDSLEQNGSDHAILKVLSKEQTILLKSALVVGADGANSQIRQLAGITSSIKEYDQCGIVARLSVASGHKNTAWQSFYKEGPIGVLPLHENQVSIVWSTSSARAVELMALNDADFAQQLYQALDAKLGPFVCETKRVSFPLRSLRAERYFNQRCVLIGDAAHNIHPLAGQGANLGMKDVACLLDLLSSEAGSIRLASLARYDWRRQQDNLLTDQTMTWLNAAFKYDFGWWPLVRGLGMQWVTRSTLLKRTLIAHAVGVR